MKYREWKSFTAFFFVVISTYICWGEPIAKNTGDKEAAADALLKLANTECKAERKDKAYELWEKIEREYPSTSAWGKAVYNRGLFLMEDKQYDAAIECFQKLLVSDVDDQETGACIMETYRNYRPKALWGIGSCYFAQGKYRKALDAYQAVEQKYPFKSWCGTCRWQYEYQYALYQGICQEHLGNYNEAVKHYFSGLQSFGSGPAIHVRLADLYENAGQVSDLLSLLDEVDAHVKKKLMKESGRKLSEKDENEFRKNGPGRIIRRVFEIRKMEQAEDFESLAALVKTKNTTAGPEELSARRENWEAIEAAKLLARHPSESIELLAARCHQEKVHNDKYIYCAIALCGTEEAVKKLNQIPVPSNCWWQQSMEFAKTIKGQADKVTYLDEGLRFPKCPKGIQLPKRLAEVDDDVAYEKSIPKTMKLDLTSPQKTITSLFQAALIGKKDLYIQCISNNDELSRGFDDINEMSQNRLFQYEQAEPVFRNDGTVEITVTFKDHRRDHTVVFFLSEIDDCWLINNFEE